MACLLYTSLFCNKTEVAIKTKAYAERYWLNNDVFFCYDINQLQYSDRSCPIQDNVVAYN